MENNIWGSVDEEVGAIKRKVIKAFGWFLIITFGVTCGNLLSTYITLSASAYVMKSSVKKFDDETKAKREVLRQQTERMNAENQEKLRALNAQRALEQERVRQQTERQRREAEQKRNIQNQLNETCKFWTNEYNKTKKELDKMHRDNACKAAKW